MESLKSISIKNEKDLPANNPCALYIEAWKDGMQPQIDQLFKDKKLVKFIEDEDDKEFFQFCPKGILEKHYPMPHDKEAWQSIWMPCKYGADHVLRATNEVPNFYGPRYLCTKCTRHSEAKEAKLWRCKTQFCQVDYCSPCWIKLVMPKWLKL